MKKSILSFLFVMTAIFANAQRLDVFGGISMTGISHKIDGKKQDGSGNINLHAGLSLFVPFKGKKYDIDEGGGGIFPALQYVKKGASKSGAIDGYAADIKLNYLQLTVPVSYTGDIFSIGVGPYGSYAIGGKKKYRVGDGKKEKIDFKNDLNRLDYGVSLHFNISVFKIQYDFGLANIGGSNTMGTARTRNFSLSLDIPLVQ